MTDKQKENDMIISTFMGHVIIDYSKPEYSYHSSWDLQIPVYAKVMPLLKEIIKNMDSWDYLYNYYNKIKGDYLKAIYNNDIKEGLRIMLDAIRHYKAHKN